VLPLASLPNFSHSTEEEAMNTATWTRSGQRQSWLQGLSKGATNAMHHIKMPWVKAASRTAQQEYSVICSKGAVWVTIGSDRRDYVVRADETLQLRGRGRLVATPLRSLGDAVYRVERI
jgi:hypothetical protein